MYRKVPPQTIFEPLPSRGVRGAVISRFPGNAAKPTLSQMRSLGIAVAFFGGAVALASPVCQPAPLSSYIALGAGGCVLQANGVTFTAPVTFSSFGFTPVLGTSASAANQIVVTPVPDPSAPALHLTSQQISGVTKVIEDVSFTVSASSISSTTLFLQEVAMIGGGTPAATATACGTGACYVLNGDGAPTSIAPVGSLVITDEMRLAGFAPGDGAQIGILGNSIATPGGYGFCDCGFPAGGPVPEPPPLALVTAAAILMAAWRRRARRPRELRDNSAGRL